MATPKKPRAKKTTKTVKTAKTASSSLQQGDKFVTTLVVLFTALSVVFVLLAQYRYN